MTTTAESLIDLIVTLLLAANTAAGSDVQAYRDWGINTNSGLFTPKITIDLPAEAKTSLGDAGPASFDVVAKITLHAFVCALAAAAPGADGGEVRVRQAALQLRRQIEVALINAPALMAEISEIKAVRSVFQGSQGQQGLHIIELAMDVALAFYQGAEDFAQPEYDDIEDMQIDVKPLDPAGVDQTLDITLT